MHSFLEMLKAEKGLSQNTIDAYKADLSRFLSFHPKPDVSTDAITSYILDLKKEFSARTAARHVSSLRQYFLFLVREGRLEKSPMRHIKAPSWRKNLPKYLSQDDVLKLLEHAKTLKNPMFYTMLELLYATGMRISELIFLPKKNILKGPELWTVLIKGKGQKERIVPIHNTAKAALETHMKQLDSSAPFLFPSRYSAKKPITRQRFAQKLKDMAISVGIDPESISPHIIRHAFATHMLKNGGNLIMIKEFLGHTNLSTSEIYLHVLPDDLKTLVETYHPLRSLRSENT